MAIDLFWWSRWSPHVGNAITITTGIPVVLSAAAALWAHIEKPGLFPAVIGLAVFMMSLWCCIGFVWLHDRKGAGRRVQDSSWGLIIEISFINFDPIGDIYCQVSVGIKNVLSWPLRVNLESMSLVIDNRTPDMPMIPTGPFILMPGVPMTINYPGYSKGNFTEKERFVGKFDLCCAYGHPDGNYTRIMQRWWRFEHAMPTNPFLNLPGMVGPLPQFIVPKTPLNGGPEKQDEDVPYSAPQN